MPGQTHTGNRYKHFLLGSRGKGRSLCPPPCLTWHFLIKALNLEGRGRTSGLGWTEKLQSSTEVFFFLCQHLSLCYWAPFFFLFSVGACFIVWLWKKCAVNPPHEVWEVSLGWIWERIPTLYILCPSVFDTLSLITFTKWKLIAQTQQMHVCECAHDWERDGGLHT